MHTYKAPQFHICTIELDWQAVEKGQAAFLRRVSLGAGADALGAGHALPDGQHHGPGRGQ